MIDHCRGSHLISKRNQTIFRHVTASGDEQEDASIRGFGLVIAAGAVLAATHANAGTFPVNMGLTGSGGDLIDQVAVRVYVAFEGRARARGSAPNTDVQSEGGAKMQGGPTGEGSSIRGSAGGSMGSAPAGEGNPRR